MTAKEIYESIDLAQVPDDLAGKLRQIEKGTKGFTIQSDKVDTFMSGVYKKLKEKRPTALKNLKVEEKVTKTEVKKGDTTQVVEDLEYKVKGTKRVTKKTPTPSKPKKSTWLGEVKKRKKKGEKWEDAKARIKKELDEERAKAKADAEKVVSQTSQALKNLEKMLAEDPKLAGYPRTYGSQSKKIDASKDAKIKALPAGKRVSKKGHKNQYGESKGGRVYWENRDNRSDRYAPNFPNKVYLEVGGETDDLGFPFGHTYLVVEVSPSGDKKMIKQTKDYITALTSSAVARAAKSSKDARVVIVDLEEKRVIHEAFEAGGEITITPTQLINNPDALVGTTTMTELFECGGVTAYQEGGEVFVTPYPLTNAGSADYVAGSNTMSNMFEHGGRVPFEEGDDYWVIENGKIVYSVWDDVSEEMHEENPNKKYFRSESEAKKYLAKMSNGGNVSVSKKGKKRFRQQNGIGKAKYTISYHDGIKKHKDGSDFFDIRIFKNKKDVDAFKKTLLQKGFVEEYENGGYIVVGDKDGFWSVASTPVSKAKAEELLKITSFPRGEKGKVVSIDEAMSHKNVIGKEYLESGGTIVAADPSAAMEDLNQTYGYESVYEKGGKLPKNIKYYGTYDIKEWRLKNGEKIDPSETDVHSGIYVSATKRTKPQEMEFQQKLEFKKGGATNWKGEKIDWKKDYRYIPVYEIEEVELENGEVIKGDYIVSGLYLPKSERTKLLEREMKARMKKGKFEVDDLVYNKKTKTIGIVRLGDDKFGEVKTDADGNVGVDDLEIFDPKKSSHSKAKVAPSTEKEINSRGLFNPFKGKFEQGGRLGFEGLAKKVAKRYEGKPVKAKYQKEYGKTYSKEEAMEVGRKVAAKVYGQQQAKMEMGGEITQPYPLINAGSAEYVAGSNTMSNMFEHGGEVGDVYLVETRYKGLPLNESLIGNLVLSEETLDKLEEEFAQDISFTPIEDSKMRPMPYAVAKEYIVNHAKNFKGLSFAKGGSVQGHLHEADKHLREAGTKLWENKNPKEAQFRKAYNQFDEKVYDLFTRRELAELGYAKGGSLMGHGLEVGDKIVKDLGSALKVSTKDGNIVYVDLASGYRDKDIPLPFAKGGDVEIGEIAMLSKENNALGHEVVKKINAGADVEMEHTEDRKLAMRIALDHLKEDYNYYEKLKKLGL